MFYVQATPDWNAPPTSVSSAYIYLDAGTNVIKMGTEFENGPNIDKFEIHATPPENREACSYSCFSV